MRAIWVLSRSAVFLQPHPTVRTENDNHAGMNQFVDAKVSRWMADTDRHTRPTLEATMTADDRTMAGFRRRLQQLISDRFEGEWSGPSWPEGLVFP
jgi:hypothetical protein